MNHQTNKELVTCTSVPLPRGKNYSRWIDHDSSRAERNAICKLSRYLHREFGNGAISHNKGDWESERIEALSICADIEKWRHWRFDGTTEQLIGYAMFQNAVEPTELFQVYLLPCCRRDSHIHLRAFKQLVVNRYGTIPIVVYPHLSVELARLFGIDKLNLHQGD